MIEFLTALLVVITGFYAWVTYRIQKANEHVVEAMREQSELIYCPYVTVAPFVEPGNKVFYLRIVNLGKTAASDLRLAIDRSFFMFGKRTEQYDLATYSAFNQPIDSLPPDSEIIFGLGLSFDIFAEDADPTTCPTTFTITATYKFGSKQVEERHFIDLRPYRNAEAYQDPLIRRLTEINKSIGELTKAIKDNR